jgi:leucyl-tRNA synthetase
MICTNELAEKKCNKRAILEPLLILLSAYAPHIAEELWCLSGHTESITYSKYPELDLSILVDHSFNYPVSFNGKTRFFKEYSLEMTPSEIEQDILNSPEAAKWIENITIKKVIIVPKKIINIVI